MIQSGIGLAYPIQFLTFMSPKGIEPYGCVYVGGGGIGEINKN